MFPDLLSCNFIVVLILISLMTVMLDNSYIQLGIRKLPKQFKFVLPIFLVDVIFYKYLRLINM